MCVIFCFKGVFFLKNLWCKVVCLIGWMGSICMLKYNGVICSLIINREMFCLLEMSI